MDILHQYYKVTYSSDDLIAGWILVVSIKVIYSSDDF